MEVLYEDNHLIAVNKKSGEIVQGDATGDEPLGEKVKRFIKQKYNKPGNVFLGVIHRLDRPVTGVVLFAKTSKGLSRMNEQFRKNLTQKTYWALTEKPPTMKEATITHFLLKNRDKNKTTAFKTPKNGAKESILSYRVLKKFNDFTWVEVMPKTGRPHQIRVQLAAQGAVIKGDLKYGASYPNKDASICLHARKLEFVHPVSKENVVIEAEVPEGNGWDAL